MLNGRVTPPQLAIPGEPIRASYINQLVRAIRKSLSGTIKGSGGVIVEQRGDAIVVSLSPGYRDKQLYRVSKVYVDGVDQALAKGFSAVALQSEITYDLKPYRAVERADILAAVPNLGRLEENDSMHIQSAAVGDPVEVYSLVIGNASERDVYIHVLSERLANPGVCAPEEPEP